MHVFAPGQLYAHMLILFIHTDSHVNRQNLLQLAHGSPFTSLLITDFSCVM